MGWSASGGVTLSWLHVLILASALTGQALSSASGGGEAKASPSASIGDDKKSDGKDKETADAAANPSKQESKKDQPKDPSAAKKGQTPVKPAARKAAPGPRVMTRSEMQKPKSPFLQPPGSEGDGNDRYGNGTPDWNEIPPWRQTSFFGIRAAGRFFVYVIDCSESMIDEDRFARATMEVRRSVLSLQAPQHFEVIFYNLESMPMPGGPKPRPADPQNKSQLVAWLRLVEPDGGTDPRVALRQALALRPEAVFLLSDGQFPDGTAEAVAHSNTRKIPIHCVDLSGGAEGDHLRRIARDSGGKYAARPGSLQGKQ
jgi:von Willebrand factor type A domain